MPVQYFNEIYNPHTEEGVRELGTDLPKTTAGSVLSHGADSCEQGEKEGDPYARWCRPVLATLPNKS